MDPHYSAAWAWAGATPFQWGKQVGSHLGGTRNPLVVHWPAHIKDAGALRTPFTHVIDVAPTILDVPGIPEPATVDGIEQEPMHGSSFSASFTDGAAPEHRTQQYFETVGNRAMYKDGWWLAMKTERIPWELTPDALAPYAPGVWDPDAGPAELYFLPDDFSQAKDLAADHPEKVQELKDLFWEEAERYKVLPLLAALSSFFGMVPPIAQDTTFEFRGDVQNVLPGMIPRIYNRSYTISADLVVPETGAEGVIVAEADHLGGFTLYVKDGKLTHTYSMMAVFVYTQVAEEDLPTGEITVRMEFLADGAKPATGGDVTLRVNDRQIGKGEWTLRCRSASRAMRAWTSDVTMVAWSIAPTRTRSHSRLRGRSRKWYSTSRRTSPSRTNSTSTPLTNTARRPTRCRNDCRQHDDHRGRPRISDRYIRFRPSVSVAIHLRAIQRSS